MSEVKITTKGLRETQKKGEQVIRDLQGGEGSPIVAGVAKSTLAVESKAKKLAPVDRGRLRASITPEVRTLAAGVVRGVVGSNLKYAPYQELGTRPFRAPWGPLFQWALRKTKGNVQAAGALAAGARRAIARRGIKAIRYLQGALEDRTDQVKRILDRAISQVVKK
jgi:hypothetical protein